MTLKTKYGIVAFLSAVFVLSLVFVQANEVLRRQRESGEREHLVAVPASSRQCVEWSSRLAD